MVVHSLNLSYSDGGSKRIASWRLSCGNLGRPYLKNKVFKKTKQNTGTQLKVVEHLLERLWIQSPIPQNK
jgi:hypothetical protein